MKQWAGKTSSGRFVNWLSVAVIACLITACADERTETSVDNEAPANISSSSQVMNLADDFHAFWLETAELPVDERVAIFKKDIVNQFPAFYDIARFDGQLTEESQDKRIANAITRHAKIAEKFLAKTKQFDADLASNIESFTQAFPDFELKVPVTLLHSLGEFDGGTRELNGQLHLLFGADGMVRFHSWDNESAFFHHELFHIHHDVHFKECDIAWCAVWTEGLATYVAKQLNPDAGLPELLLDFPSGMATKTQEQLRESLEHLQTVLDSDDKDVYKSLFNTDEDETGLPARRGYYLGYLIAQELGKSHDMATLAAMKNEQIQPLIPELVKQLLDSTDVYDPVQ
jgi:hypothetical protein